MFNLNPEGLNLNNQATNNRRLPRVGDKVTVKKRANPIQITRVDSFRGVAEGTTARGSLVEVYDDGNKLTADLVKRNGREDLGRAKILEKKARKNGGQPGQGFIQDAFNGM